MPTATTGSTTAATAATTPTEGEARHSWTLPGLLGCLLGAALLVAGSVQLLSALVALDGQAVLWEIRRGSKVAAGDIALAADRLALADRIYAQGGLASDRGFLLVQQAELTPPGPQRDALLAEAAAATATALRMAPGNPSAWARLAYLDTIAGRPDAAAEALEMSFLTGQIAPMMQASRLALGLRLLPFLDPEAAEMLRRQVRYTWLAAPDALIPLAGDPRTGAFVREALKDLNDTDVDNFVRRYTP